MCSQYYVEWLLFRVENDLKDSMDSSSTSSVEMRPSMPTLVGIPMGMPVYNNNNYTSEMVGGAMAGMSNRNANSEIGSKRKKGIISVFGGNFFHF